MTQVQEVAPATPIPPDDGVRQLTVAAPDDPALPHIGMVGDTYTVLLSGRDTAGRFAVIDMFVPNQGGPPPHRHDFEETFHVLEGTLEVTFRGETSTLHAGETANVPANALHAFRNAGDTPVRMLGHRRPGGPRGVLRRGGSGRTDPDLARARADARAAGGADGPRSRALRQVPRRHLRRVRAVRYAEYGGTDVLRLEEVHDPRPASGQVLVEVAATSFNQLDATLRSGVLLQALPVRLPHVPGLDVAGTVVTVGDGVDGLERGRGRGFLPITGGGAAGGARRRPADVLAAAPTRSRWPTRPRCRPRA
jgi:quercetin dioxygenase-like cupin family protein